MDGEHRSVRRGDSNEVATDGSSHGDCSILSQTPPAKSTAPTVVLAPHGDCYPRSETLSRFPTAQEISGYSEGEATTGEAKTRSSHSHPEDMENVCQAFKILYSLRTKENGKASQTSTKVGSSRRGEGTVECWKF